MRFPTPGGIYDASNESAFRQLVEQGFAEAARKSVGPTSLRPEKPATGDQYFDTTIGLPVWFDGTNWINAAGVTV